jgi:mannose-6-phosphate isomerase-like protein (cupin superfamily)
MKDHVSSEHEYEFTGPARHAVRRYQMLMFQVPISMFQVTLQNVSPGKNYGKAILIDNQLFLLVWEIREDTFYFAVFYAGHEKEATGVTYEFEIYRKALKFAISGVCHSYLQEKRKVLTPGECVTIHYGAVQKFVSESKELTCVIKIGKVSWFPPIVPQKQFVAVASDTSCLSDKSC